MPTTGSCLCGAATFTLAETPKHMGACHCGQCRKWSGGVLLSVEVAPDAMTISTGETITAFKSSDWGERAFCSACGSSLYFRLTAPGPMQGTYYISAGTLDAGDPALHEELFIDEKPAGYALQGQHKMITGPEFFAMIEEAMKPQS